MLTGFPYIPERGVVEHHLRPRRRHRRRRRGPARVIVRQPTPTHLSSMVTPLLAQGGGGVSAGPGRQVHGGRRQPPLRLAHLEEEVEQRLVGPQVEAQQAGAGRQRPSVGTGEGNKTRKDWWVAGAEALAEAPSLSPTKP